MGKPLTEEHKKKISEALKKGGRATPKKAPTTIGGIMKDQYTKSERNVDLLKNQFSGLRDEYSSVSKKYPIDRKLSKEKKAAIKDQIKAEKAAIKEKMAILKEKVKKEREYQKKLKDQARAALRIKKAEAKITKAEANKKKSGLLKDKVNSLLTKVKKPKQRQSLMDRLARIDASIAKQDENIASYKAFINTGGHLTPLDVFNFNDLSINTHCLTSKKGFSPWRELTQYEQKTDFVFLGGAFNDLENDLEAELNQAIDEDIEKNVKKIENKIKNEDIAAIAAMSFIMFPKLYRILIEYLKKSFEIGKKTGAEELKVERPKTSLKKTQLMNFEAAQIAENFINEVDAEAKEKAKVGLSRGIATVAVVAAVNEVVKKRAKRFIITVKSSVVSTGINEGRREVFEKHINLIQGYQRSEILDERTCNICMSLDMRRVKASDPIAGLEKVHDNCRGLWIPILVTESVDGSWGIPKSILNHFETVGGAPSTNSFKQMKTAINEGNKEVEDLIKRKEEKKKE